MSRDILSCSVVANRDVVFFVRNGPNPLCFLPASWSTVLLLPLYFIPFG